MRVVSSDDLSASVRVLPNPEAVSVLRQLLVSPSVLDYDGHSGPTSCMGCPDAPCTRLTDEESTPPHRIPTVDNRTVCPTEAIAVPVAGKPPTIDPGSCIGCGLCVDRCPSSAIYYAEDSVSIDWPKDSAFVGGDAGDELFEATRTSLQEAARHEFGVDVALGRVRDLLRTLEPPGISSQQFALLIRGLLIQQGIQSQLGKPGDHAIRVELVGGDDEALLLGQIEYESDMLTAARRTLSAAAVLMSRYEIRSADLVPVVFCLGLPNARVDLYRVIDAARERLGIEIAVVPVSVLMICTLLRRWLSVRDLARFRIDDEDRQDLRGVLNEMVQVGEPALSDLGLQPVK